MPDDVAVDPRVPDAIQKAAEATGVPVQYLTKTARRESGFDPENYPGKAEGLAYGQGDSRALGLFQFTPETWDDMLRRRGAKYGLGVGTSATDPYASALMAAEFTRENSDAIRAATGRDPSEGDLYIAHFMGRSGGPAFLKAAQDTPGATAADLFPKAASANRSIFYDKDGTPRTVAQVQAALTAQHDGAPVSLPRIGFEALTTPNIPATASAAVADTIRAQHAEATASLWEGVKDTFQYNTLIGQISREASPAPYDPNFRWTPETFKEAVKGLPPDYHAAIAEAHSAEHAQWLRQQVEQEITARQSLANLGWKAPALSVAANLLDPIAWGVMAATDGAAAGLLLPANAGRGLNAAVRATSGALGGVGVEALSAGTALQSKHLADYLEAAGFGLAAGGALGVMHRAIHPPVAGELQRIGEGMAGEGRALRTAQAAEEGVGAGSAGAARAAPEAPFTVNDEGLAAVQNHEIPESLGTAARFGVVAQLDKSGIPVARQLAVLGEENVGKVGDNLNPFSTELHQRRIEFTRDAEFKREYRTQLAAWLKEQGSSDWARFWRSSEFAEAVVRYMRDPEANAAAPASVRAMAAKTSGLFSEFYKDTQNPLRAQGVEGRTLPGWENVKPNERYVPRVYDPRRIREAVARFGQGPVEDVVFGAIRSQQPTLEDAVARKLARGLTKRIVRDAHGLDDDMRVLFLSNDVEALRTHLERDFGMDAEDIQKVLDALPQRREGGTDSYARQRVLLDENFGLTGVRDRNGVAGDLHFQDLLVNDLTTLWESYNRRMSGRVALGATRIKDPATGDLLVNGIGSDAEFAKLLNLVRQQAADMGLHEKADEAVKNLEFLYNKILGRPTGPEMGTFGDALRIGKKFNFARLSGFFGITQAAEFANTVGNVGVRAVLQQVPAFRRIAKMTAAEMEKHGLLQEIEAYVGVGTEDLRQLHFARWDEMGPDYRSSINPTLHRVENGMDLAGRVANKASGFAYVNEKTQQWTAAAVMQRFANLADNPTKANKRRMASLGLDEEMLGRALGQLKDHAEFREGTLGKQLKVLNLAKWDDLEAREAFLSAVQRWSRRAIQENDYGSMAKWMSHPLASALMQFNVFVTHAYEKQFLHNVYMRDFQTFTTWAWTFFAGGLAYIAQEQIKNAGKGSSADLDKAMQPHKIALGAINKMGASTIFPRLVDTVLGVTPLGPQFASRTTGQASDVLLGNAPAGLINDVAGSAKAVMDMLLSDKATTQQAAHKVVRPMLWQNTIPSILLFNKLFDHLPDSGHH